MNSKGQSLGLAILSALFILIVGFMCINFLMPEITNFRVAMECSSPSTISDGVKVLCLITDATIPYWIIAILSLAIGGITSRFAIS